MSTLLTKISLKAELPRVTLEKLMKDKGGGWTPFYSPVGAGGML